MSHLFLLKNRLTEFKKLCLYEKFFYNSQNKL